MKIYHTETQEDYDALMVELEAKGYTWGGTTSKPTQWNGWSHNKENTCIRTLPEDKELVTMHKVHYVTGYPQTPITKYKAKADEKMRFNKQNIERAFDKFMQGGDSVADLKRKILKLDDTPEKVVVPKYIADYLEERKRDGDGLVTSLYPYQGNSGEAIEDWFEEEENNVSFARAWIDGYTIEEPMYEVVIHETEGDRLLLVTLENIGYKFEFESDNEGFWKQRHTEKEIKAIDKRYWAFAVPAEGKE